MPDQETPNRVAALKCAHAHVTIWPEHLTPYPEVCPCWVGDDRDRCGARVHDTGARFDRVEGNGA